MAIDKKFIGRKYPIFTYEVGKEKIKEYAKAIKSMDRHFLDDDFAKQSKYGAIIAPPTFAVVYGATMVAPVFGDSELKLNMAMLVHGEQQFDFFEVVKAGDVLTLETHIAHIENKEKLDVISIEVNAKNQLDQKVSRGLYTFVVRK